MLYDYIAYVHIKDCKADAGIVPYGNGVTMLRNI